MNINECTKDRVIKDIADHTMKVIKDDGVHRHISFSNNGSSVYRFDLITWPGKLCISSDCGTYVFARVEDMFAFFRGNGINKGYWGEKLESVDKSGGYKEFSPEMFEQTVKEDFETWVFESDEQKALIWSDVEDYVLSFKDDGEYAAFAAAIDYRYTTSNEDDKPFEFVDFWEHGLKEYTFHYVWCLWAIVEGIKMYDKSKTGKAV